MKVRLPKFDNQSFLNDLIPVHAIGMWTSKASSRASSGYTKTLDNVFEHFPIKPGSSEDQVVEAVISFLNILGWKAKDKRSTFLEGTRHKPDIWLDGQTVFVEALSLPASFNNQNWIQHCARTVEYSKYSSSRIAICTDGRRWFVASTLEGELKFAFVDLKKFDKSSSEAKLLAALLWKAGPLYDKNLNNEIREYSHLTKKIFKNHVMKVIGRLGDEYREYFGLVAAAAYAHYNKVASETINTKAIYDCVYALKHEHFEAAIEIAKNYFDYLEKENLPGLSNLASRVKRIVGKKREMDVSILSALLLDHADRPLSWDTFNSDDLSEVYEELCRSRRKQNGIYATQRDVCYHVVKRQLDELPSKSNPKSLALIDPCCGSGSFLDQAARLLGETVFPPGRRKSALNKTKSLCFYGQDKEEVAVAISMVNVAVACARYLWHVENLDIDIHLSCGDSTDRRSQLFKKVESDKPAYRVVFGNPPYLRSRTKTFGGSGASGNLLFHVTDKVMELCQPGELAFVLPAHIKGGDAAGQFDDVSDRRAMRITEFWHLPEIKFRGCSEKRHVVVFWEPDKRASAKILILTPPENNGNLDIFKSLAKSKSSSTCQFKVDRTPLAEIPLYANQYIPRDIGEAFDEIPTLLDLKKKSLLSVVQGVQVVHPRVPHPSKKGEDKSRLNDVLEREGYKTDDSMFCIEESEMTKFRNIVHRNLTEFETNHLKSFAENVPTSGGIRLSVSKQKILFTNKDFSRLSESSFEEQAPHFCAWLKPFKPLLMLDNDRKRGALKWWEIHRSCPARPNAKKNPGIDFDLQKVLVARMLNGDLWAWYDNHGHVAGGTSFCAISPWPESGIEGSFREGWNELISAWLNSYLIRQIWVKLLNNFKLRGVDGEVQMKHLLKIPMLEAFLYESEDKKLEKLIDELSQVADLLRTKTDEKNLIKLDLICWKILEYASGKDLGSPITRKKMGPVELKAVS